MILEVKRGSTEEQFCEDINKSKESFTIKTQDSDFSFEKSSQPPKANPKNPTHPSPPLTGELSADQVKVLDDALKVYGRVSIDSKLNWLSRLVKADIQSITEWFETRDPSQHRSNSVTKVKKLDMKTKRTNKKVKVKQEVEKETPLKKLIKTTPKKPKIRDISIQPQTGWKEKIHVQKSQCQNRMYSNFEKCRSCIHKNGDVCRFKDFRVFQESSKGQLIYGPMFQTSTTITKPCADSGRNKRSPKASVPKELLMLGSRLSFPPEIGVEHESYLRKIIAPSLMTIVDREIQFMRDKTYYQRATSMGVRQMCDVCLTSIFNGFWLCCVCGMEVCLYCYDEWTTRVGMCSYKRTHDKSQMIRVTRVNLNELERLRIELLPDATSADNISNLEGSIKKDFCEAEYLCEDYDKVDLKQFQEKWRKGETVVIRNLLPKVKLDWTPSYFSKHHGNEEADMVDCSTGCTVANMTVGDFFRGFSDVSLRPSNKEEKHLIMRIKVSIANMYQSLALSSLALIFNQHHFKDWPSDMDFKDKFPKHFVDFMKSLPFQEYTQRRGILNLASRLPSMVVPPDLGPKMYNAYGSDDGENGVGTTPLHLDMADAVNLMVYSINPMDSEATCQESGRMAEDSSVTDKHNGIGAVWDIYHFQDLAKIRCFLRKYAAEIGHPIDDPIHDQIFYLNKVLRQRLFDEYGVQGWRVYQNPGDVVFIPAGCAHQVCNYQSCIKVAMDFVSPENVSKCAELTKEFRLLSQGHRRRQDLLQLESILYYSWLGPENSTEDSDINESPDKESDEASAQKINRRGDSLSIEGLPKITRSLRKNRKRSSTLVTSNTNKSKRRIFLENAQSSDSSLTDLSDIVESSGEGKEQYQ